MVLKVCAIDTLRVLGKIFISGLQNNMQGLSEFYEEYLYSFRNYGNTLRTKTEQRTNFQTHPKLIKMWNCSKQLKLCIEEKYWMSREVERTLLSKYMTQYPR